MVDDGSVEPGQVLLVLEASGVEISLTSDSKGHVLRKGNKLEVQYFSERVSRRVVLRLAHKLSIPSSYFWHPEQMPDEICPPGLQPN